VALGSQDPQSRHDKGAHPLLAGRTGRAGPCAQMGPRLHSLVGQSRRKVDNTHHHEERDVIQTLLVFSSSCKPLRLTLCRSLEH
jgi:hypothetical protein